MNLELVDTHCHLDFDHFNDDRDQVVQRAVEAGVMRIVVPGLDLETNQRAIDLAEQYQGVYAAVGIHPNNLGPRPDPLGPTLEHIRELAAHPKVVAIGEIGLDYYWKKTPKGIQHIWLKQLLRLAGELGLPVILHNREATGDMLRILTDWCRSSPASSTDRLGVLHSFSGTWEDAQAALEMGFHLGFTGPITFKKAHEMRKVARNAPEKRILIETDAPFLTPHPHRGERNEPAYVRYTAERLAKVRDMDLNAIAAQTTSNARMLFSW